MFAKKRRAPPPRGHGDAAATRMGLFMDVSPEDMVTGMDENLDDPALEAELAALTGGTSSAGGRPKHRGKNPLPMEDIARMADECMKDIDDDDDENLEDDEDLMAELQEVVGEGEDEDAITASPTSSVTAESPQEDKSDTPPPKQETVAPSVPGSLQHTLEQRIAMYKTAVQNAKSAGEASKARRFDRGLKNLESMLSAVKKGKPVNEAEIPPPVATGASAASPKPPVPPRPAPPAGSPAPPPSESESESSSAQLAPDAVEPGADEATPPVTASDVSSPEELVEEPRESSPAAHAADDETKTLLLERQREYRMAALQAKKQGDLGRAKLLFKTSKSFDAAIEALEKGEAVDLSSLPPALEGGGGSGMEMESSSGPNTEVAQPAAAAPAPAAPSVPEPPKTVLEALEQRRQKYLESSTQAKASGEERRARMHDRIAKQYQSAIRAHKAGKAVNFEELPVPPGFPPIPGQASAAAPPAFADVLETANKLATNDPEKVADEDEDEEKEEPKPVVPEKPRKLTLDTPATAPQHKKTPSPSLSLGTPAAIEGLSPTAAEQLGLLEGRRKQYMRAALQAKQRGDVEQAKQLVRTAKGLEASIQAARRGQTLDASTLPSPPGDEDEDFILVHHDDVKMSEKAEEVYAHLDKLLKEQQQMCVTYSKQFTHMGNVAETTKFEKLAERCKKSLEILKLSQARGLPPPRHHFEERTFHTVRIFPELSSTEMVVVIVRGMNLPAPSGIQTNDLDAYVKLELPYPSTDQSQKHKTAVVKNTNSPEYNQSFTLTINRNHRGFRRVVQSKGLKLELLHKGGFLRSDKPVGTATVKLDKLETQSEIREIVEVMDGRKPTGGRVEVKVRLREPLSGQDLQTSTERWLVLDQSQVVM